MTTIITPDIELSNVYVGDLPYILEGIHNLSVITGQAYTLSVRGTFVTRKGETIETHHEYKVIAPEEYKATMRKRFYTLQEIARPVRPLSDRFSFVRISFHAQEPSEEEYKRIAQGERATEEHLANCR